MTRAIIFGFASICLAQDFSADVQPLLRRRCYGCHGAAAQMSGLRLDHKADAMRRGVVTPGNSGASKLIEMVEKRAMPPSGPKLTPEEIALLRSWIDKGAAWPEGESAQHWAFQPIRKPKPPLVKSTAWVRNPIDAFILARLENENVAPSPEADRITLFRRLNLDLTGLPPSPAEVDAFLTGAESYERAIDRLLASPHFGEKWARSWLDLARYSDSDGYQKDEVRPNAWRYRDWVIGAFNRNMPFDQFTIEQIAGDLLPQATAAQKTATGFHRMTLTSREAGIDLAQLRAEQVADRANTTGSVWLGLTVGCAMCHDHKFDPISQKEYYRFYAFFDSSREASLEAPLPQEVVPYQRGLAEYLSKRRALIEAYRVPSLQPEFERKMREAARPGAASEWLANYELLPVLVDGGDAILAKEPAQRSEWENYLMQRYLARTYGRVAAEAEAKKYHFDELLKRLDALDEAYPRFSEPMVLAEIDAPPQTHIHIRGDFRRPGEAVQPGTPAALPPLPEGVKANRLALARWMVADDNPLTARVEVNRLWQELFGRGLVATSDDFGSRGDAPSHPELLDWLATDFREHGWEIKYAIRQMMLSAAYRQSSKPRQEPEALVARQMRFRLPAELIRDGALAASGLLDPRVGGRSVRPPLPEGVTNLGFENFMKWPESVGPDKYRRGLYTLMHRSVPYPQMVMFDAPDGLISCSRRNRSTTPLQALELLNDPVFFEAAQGLAARTFREAGPSDEARIDYAFRVALSRTPSAGERARLLAYYRGQANWAGLSSVILNLDEFLTRE